MAANMLPNNLIVTRQRRIGTHTLLIPGFHPDTEFSMKMLPDQFKDHCHVEDSTLAELQEQDASYEG